jgi:hypothetical protein
MFSWYAQARVRLPDAPRSAKTDRGISYPGGREVPMIHILITVVAVITVTVTISIRMKRR